MNALYLAYGSNLHPMRLQQRVSSATLRARLRLGGYRLEFNKRGKDGSGKCNIRFTGRLADAVFGAVYTLDPREIHVLDRFEGAGYERQQLAVEVRGGRSPVFAYVAPDHHCDDGLLPFDWYRQLVFWGARFHGFPAAYLDLVQGVPVVEDDDVERRELNGGLVARIKAQVVRCESSTLKGR
jgi:hypothetical protein